jgi:glycosyltransferase involved in cell wall biosynthesis
VRVLAVGNMYPPHHQGGYELIWQGAVGALRASGHEVRVLTTDHREPVEPPAGPAEPDVYRDLRWYWRDHDWPDRGWRERARVERSNAEVMRRHLGWAPDVVAWWAMGGMSFSLFAQAQRAGLGSAAFVLDDWLMYGPERDLWIYGLEGRPVLQRLARRATGVPTWFDPHLVDRWVFGSRSTRDRTQAVRGEIGSTAIEPPGIDTRAFPVAPPAPWNWRLVYIGRIDARKGIATAVRALPLLPEASLTVVGTGDDKALEELRATARECGVEARVNLVGGVARDSLGEAYAQGDVVVFPVLWEEPFGLVPLEAMAVGRPVVATGRGGSAEFLRHGENCLLFGPDDPADLAAAVRRLAAEASLRERLVENGRETAAHYSDARYHDAVERALESVARRPG